MTPGTCTITAAQAGNSAHAAANSVSQTFTPYPIAAWNALGTDGDLTSELTSVKAIDIDHHNHLWVLNCPTGASGGDSAEAAALVEIELKNNKPRRVISLESMADI